MTYEIAPSEPATATRQFSVLLSPTRRGARLARLLAVAHLANWGLPTETSGQIVAELANNAVQHGRVPGRDFQLTLTVLDEMVLRIEVADARWELIPPSCAEPPAHDAVSGRGLQLVAALSDHWGVTSEPPHKTVWADLRLRRPHPAS